MLNRKTRYLQVALNSTLDEVYEIILNLFNPTGWWVSGSESEPPERWKAQGGNLTNSCKTL